MATKKEGEQPIIIIVKKKKGGHGHHGGAWKVAFADFTTAMMAFFLLMWLMGSTTKVEKQFIAGYFNDPSGASALGPGGASQGVIPMEEAIPVPPSGQLDNETSNNSGEQDADAEFEQDNASTQSNAIDILDQESENAYLEAEESEQQQEIDEKKAKEKVREEERKTLSRLQDNLEDALQSEDVFKLLKDQVLIDITPMGLRIQIIDKDNRPSFNSGSASMQFYTEEMLAALAPLLDSVPNRISITGHTDATAYAQGAEYTNWELSADRANAARRALLDGGYPEQKIAKVEGFGDSLPFDLDNPMDPINRRIAIVLLKKEVDEGMKKDLGVNADNFLEEGSVPEY